MKSYRRLAAVGSILTHLLVLAVLGLLSWQPSPSVREEVEVLVEFGPFAEKSIESVPRPLARRQPSEQPIFRPASPVAVGPGQVIVPRDSLLAEKFLRDSVVDAERQFFGDTLYGILQKYPELKSAILQELLVQHVPAYDSLATLRKQIAEALAPYLEMSDAERAARANMKRFGTAQNPHHVQAIPGNIPITAIIMYLIQLLTQ